jgi:catechol 2,3-dioxygenase-like lactoylglutathione lyase family enzyme
MGFSVERFDHIVINCRDVDATAQWYATVLGMTIERFGPTARTAVKFGIQKINLRPLGTVEQDPGWATGAVEAAGSEDLCFVTSASPDAVSAHLESCGWRCSTGP